jgi:hypothetical protein
LSGLVVLVAADQRRASRGRLGAGVVFSDPVVLVAPGENRGSIEL